MATLVLSAAGSALGGAVGGSLAGLGAGALGRAAGSIAGGLIDQQVFGRGADTVETGRLKSFRVQGATPGAALPKVFGRMRVGGQLIWSSDFLETVDESRQGGKGGQKVREYSYSVSFAVGLCEGKISRIGRIWADGNELTQADYVMHLHKGGENQQPDALITAVEGEAPAFRGLAYLVFENMPIGAFGNRIPQLNVEVFYEPQPADSASDEVEVSLSELTEGVALSPGSGEFSLETEPVLKRLGPGQATYENVNTLAERPDLLPALDQLSDEAPNCGAVSLIVSWFGDDLRCDACDIRPCVETDDKVTEPVEWRVNGVGRGAARVVSEDAEGRPIFGGTPSDRSVIKAIQEIRARGMRVMFYPFILMDVPGDNSKPNPWTGTAPQPAFPWRGRITLNRAPGVAGSADKTAAAADEVADFFGAAAVGDFTQNTEGVDYGGPQEWSMRRFILHYAHLCAAAGGVDAFCIGSEMRSLTQIRSSASEYPAVEAFKSLVGDVRTILGPTVDLGYAADWSEYFGHQPGDGTGDVFFHLDPLWSDPEIDFVGIDNYLPLADWRKQAGHADAEAGSVYSLPYLKGNVEGGEGYEWYYADAAARDAQTRTPIQDGAHGEDWVFRPKDLKNWWSNAHYDRPGGVRQASPTGWTPGSKPIWFTELGCPAVDVGANQPNVFVDPKSSESFLPYFSDGVRDDYMQRRYLQAMIGYWRDPANNPAATLYSGRMIDVSNTYLWTWDARPWPDFPSRRTTWSDGENHRLGHWITGRLGAASLADVVAEICRDAGLDDFDVSELKGVVDGASFASGQNARERLQPLMLAYGFDAVESGGRLLFRHRDGAPIAELDAEAALLNRDGGAEVEQTRGAEGELPRAIKFSFIASDAEYETNAVEAQAPAARSTRVESASAPLALDEGAAQGIADRWLSEAHVGRDGARYIAPRSTLAVETGDLVTLGGARYRIDRVEELGRREMTLTRVEPDSHRLMETRASRFEPKPAAPAAPVAHHLMDLPLFGGIRTERAAWLAALADPWTSAAALYLERSPEDFVQLGRAATPAVMGELAVDLPGGAADRFQRVSCDVRIFGGGLASVGKGAVLNGANLAAVLSPSGEWELIQFQDAVLLESGDYRISNLLRGQGGTDPFIGAPTPAGAPFVLLNASVAEIPLDGELLGLDLTCRVGPARKTASHAAYRTFAARIDGAAYRPYRPAHLTARTGVEGINLDWKRRSRVADGWSSGDPPLGEDREAYLVRVSHGAALLREVEVGAPSHLYAAADMAFDGAAGAIEIAVAQLSTRFGPGPEAKVTINV